LDAPSDEKLLQRFVDGRKAALGDLARRYEGPLLGLAKGLLRGRDDLAQDAVQETWVRVIRFAHTFNGNAGLKTWVYRIAINQCRDLAALATRRDARNRAMESRESDDGKASPDAPTIQAERDDQVRRAVDTLDDAKREILLLCYHEGLTHVEAAEALEIPIGTLKSRLHAALDELRKRLNREAL
jgi:RNA polymerase sigma-70 factor (ECF subfamily)